MRIACFRYTPFRTLLNMAPKPKVSKQQPKISAKLVRERSPASSADEKPPKKLASTTATSESETEQKPSTSSSNQASSKPIEKIMEKNLASIFNPLGSKGKDEKANNLANDIDEKRKRLYTSIQEFRFNKKRVKVLSDAGEIPKDAEGILYWMSRDQRVQDNWALLYAQKLALKQNLPLIVCFCIVPTFLGATLRHYHFMLEGLKEVEEELKELNISFVLLEGQAKDQVPKFVKENKIGGVICDFCPLRVPMSWTKEVQKGLPQDIPFAQVDAHNVVPCWFASDKQEYGARTIRNKINSKLDDFLTEFPPVIKHPHDPVKKVLLLTNVDWNSCYKSLQCDMDVKVVEWAKPGYKAGIQTLHDFIKIRIRTYDTERNDPNKNALSQLSPWTHFGQISCQRNAIEVKKYTSKFSKAVAGFLEESIVRRELADNFCYYQPNYDNIDGAFDWAKTSLELHMKDKRQNVYTYEQLDNFKTHDRLWNAAQIQLRVEGKMHGFLRMYWAKKVLEWTETPAQGLEFAIKLNDRYSLDGRDPAGYVGCMWSIVGIHDQGWAERAVFGKIRYMNYEGCKRKFNIEMFMNKYHARKHLV